MCILWDGAQPACRANVYLRWMIIKTASTAAQEDESNENVDNRDPPAHDFLESQRMHGWGDLSHPDLKKPADLPTHGVAKVEDMNVNGFWQAGQAWLAQDRSFLPINWDLKKIDDDEIKDDGCCSSSWASGWAILLWCCCVRPLPDLLGAMVYADPLSGVWKRCSPNTTGCSTRYLSSPLTLPTWTTIYNIHSLILRIKLFVDIFRRSLFHYIADWAVKLLWWRHTLTIIKY